MNTSKTFATHLYKSLQNIESYVIFKPNWARSSEFLFHIYIIFANDDLWVWDFSSYVIKIYYPMSVSMQYKKIATRFM